MTGSDECPDRVRSILDSLEIPLEVIKDRSLVLQPEAEDLVLAELGDDGREHKLVPVAAKAWLEMSASACAGGVTIKIASAFRSVDRQAEIVRGKLARGLPLDAILCVSAPPGYSEHHTGRAVDVTTNGVTPLELEFEQTAAFQWLSGNAHRYGFTLSYPRQNPHGYAYEPWHWCFTMSDVTDLHDSVKRGDLAAIRILLDANRALVNARSETDARGTYPLHVAAEFNQAGAARQLLDYGADMSLLDLENDSIALCWAAFFGRPEVVALLLDAGSETNQRNKHGLTPLGCAVGGAQGRWRTFSKATLDDWRKCAEAIRMRGGVE